MRGCRRGMGEEDGGGTSAKSRRPVNHIKTNQEKSDIDALEVCAIRDATGLRRERALDFATRDRVHIGRAKASKRGWDVIRGDACSSARLTLPPRGAVSSLVCRHTTMRALRHLLVALALLTPGGGGRGGVGVAHARTFPTEVNTPGAQGRVGAQRDSVPALDVALSERGRVRPLRPRGRRLRLVGRMALHRVPPSPGDGARRGGEAGVTARWSPQNRVPRKGAVLRSDQHTLSAISTSKARSRPSTCCSRFRHLRELDLDGGRLRRPHTQVARRMLPHLTELDLRQPTRGRRPPRPVARHAQTSTGQAGR